VLSSQDKGCLHLEAEGRSKYDTEEDVVLSEEQTGALLDYNWRSGHCCSWEYLLVKRSCLYAISQLVPWRMDGIRPVLTVDILTIDAIACARVSLESG
jgi:hypothetical protein